jgi:hypothetical protein
MDSREWCEAAPRTGVAKIRSPPKELDFFGVRQLAAAFSREACFAYESAEQACALQRNLQP